MSKSIVIKSAIVLAVSALVYSAFWFFKVGQVEKQIKNFITENSHCYCKNNTTQYIGKQCSERESCCKKKGGQSSHAKSCQ